MQRKLNEAFLSDYCSRFCEIVSGSFFDSHDTIDGKSILSLTPSKQVNFFILKTLFTSWQEEMKRLESPYFNFKDAEVRGAMVSFMNLLSQKIEVDRENFEPLLSQALDQTFRILVDPSGFVVAEFDSRGVDHVSEKSIKTFLKYVKVYKEEFDEAFTGLDGISVSELATILDDHFSEIDPGEELRNHLDILSEIIPIEVEDLLIVEVDDHFEEAQPETIEELTPDFDDLESSEVAETVEEPESELDEIGEEEAETFISNQEGQSDASRELSYHDDVEEDPEQEPIDELEEDEPTDGDTSTDEMESLRDEAHQDLASVSAMSEKVEAKIGSMLDSIPTSNRSVFIKVLFEGEKQAFHDAMEQIEECTSFDEAVELIVHQHAKARDWDMNSDEVKELLKAVFRRFR